VSQASPKGAPVVLLFVFVCCGSGCVRAWNEGQFALGVCQTDVDCATASDRGRCESAAGYCSFPDTTCASGWRFAVNANTQLSGRCAPAGGGLDGAVDGPPDGPLEGGGDLAHCGGAGQACCQGSLCSKPHGCVDGTCRCLAAVRANEWFTCARRATGEIWCWGDNTYGQLGLASKGTDQLLPKSVSTLTDSAGIDLGAFHACSWRPTGQVSCWGLSADHQTGQTSVADITTPTLVTGLSGAAQVAAGGYHSCARTQVGTVLCWGIDTNGQLGDGTIGVARAAPQPVVGFDKPHTYTSMDLAAGGFHNVLARDGEIWCWGLNQDGQLGVGTTGASKPTPVQVKSLGGVAQVTAGDWHSCALKDDGTAWCWGRNSSGQLGNGVIGAARSTPQQVKGTGYQTLAAGDNHTCAIKQDATAWCWGANTYGQLGIGTAGVDKPTPVQVKGLVGVLSLASGRYHSCAVTAAETLHCWGANGDGVLGTGDKKASAAPVQTKLTCP
jgi:alpha-tubulin suppressor-like RCC1 family protein